MENHSAFRIAFLKLVDEAKRVSEWCNGEHQKLMSEPDLAALDAIVQFVDESREFAFAFRAEAERT